MKRVLALLAIIPLCLVCLTVTESARAADDARPLGDPIYGDEGRDSAPQSRAQVSTSGLTDLQTWSPALRTNAATAAYINADDDVVFQASRSENPALLFTNSLTDGGIISTEALPDTTGSWDMTMNGTLLAVGTNGNGVRRPAVVVGGGGQKALRTLELPASSSKSAYVMALAPDPSNVSAFWVGTYDPSGARLYFLDTSTGRFRDFTPGTSWSSRGLKYVRSLAVNSTGVVIGMGSPATTWLLPTSSEGVPLTPVELPDALGGITTSMVYAIATGNAADGTEMVVLGTDTRASVSVLNSAGDNLYTYTFSDDFATVDRAVVDDVGTAWFTVRPTGDLYSLELGNLQEGPTLRSRTVLGSETRALDASLGTVRGVTGTRRVWTFESSGSAASSTSLDRPPGTQNGDTASQGVLSLEDQTLVGGHWRYEGHSDEGSTTIDIPGEPKKQIRVGDKVYSAVYPSASLFEVDAETQVATFIARASNTQVRPRSLAHSEENGLIYMGTSGAYGTYGGGISSIDPGTGALTFYDTPVSRQMPFSMAALGEDLVVGTSTAGEAMGAQSGLSAAVVRWRNGNVLWQTDIAGSPTVAGVAVIRDDAGPFIFATTTNRRALALDAETGAVLWQKTLPASIESISVVGNYVSGLTGGDVIEYFPSRSSLSVGLTLARGVRWLDMQGAEDAGLDVAAVTSGSSSALRASIAHPRRVTRDAGSDRYTTAIAASRATFSTSSYAVLATGLDFPDALSAGPLAARLGAPVLLTVGSSPHRALLQELDRLSVKTLYIVGGPGVVPNSIEQQLRSRGIQVKRLGGLDRFDTSILVAHEILSINGGNAIPAVVTTGMAFPDALSATPAAGEMGGAIILTRDGTLTGSGESFISSSKVSKIVTIGGPAETALRRAGIKPEWSATGTNRYDTSAKVAKRSFPNAEIAYVATGADFPDGLAAGAVAAHSGAPVLLSTAVGLPSVSLPSLKLTTRVTLVGGDGVLESSLVTAIREVD